MSTGSKSRRPIDSPTEIAVDAIWRCPLCRGELDGGNKIVQCGSCGHIYPIVGGVVDLRIQVHCEFDLEEDRTHVDVLADHAGRLDTEQLIRRVFEVRPGWTPDLVDLRTRQVMRAPDRLGREIDGWLGEMLYGAEPFLDLGCGPGMLLAAATSRECHGIGVDISLEWLVVARRLIADFGGSPVLAAGCGEALPLEDGSVDCVAGMDVIEHVAQAKRILREIDRVLRPGGGCVLTTPNRFSLTPEPHVFVWGVGWLPRRLQGRYVRWRSGRSYGDVKLFSSWELIGLIRRHTNLEPRIEIPPVDEADARGSKGRLFFIRLYNRLIVFGVFRTLFLLCGPFFRVLAQKRPAAAA